MGYRLKKLHEEFLLHIYDFCFKTDLLFSSIFWGNIHRSHLKKCTHQWVMSFPPWCPSPAFMDFPRSSPLNAGTNEYCGSAWFLSRLVSWCINYINCFASTNVTPLKLRCQWSEPHYRFLLFLSVTWILWKNHRWNTLREQSCIII